jgi:hypothetical protein
MLERRLSGHISVQGMARSVVVLISLGASTKLKTQEDIPDASLIHRLLQVLAIEVRRNARVRIRTNVYEKFDVLAADERREPLKVVVGMPDGPQSGAWRHASYATSGS